MITEPAIPIHPKFVTPFLVPNLLHMMWATNNNWAVPASHDARRYAVFKVSEERVGILVLRRIKCRVRSGGIEAMMFDLLQMGLGKWHPKFIYKTQALWSRSNSVCKAWTPCARH